jgi:hypothetical protein
MDFEELRKRQQQRIDEAGLLLNAAKQQLQSAIALTESRELELRNISEDVQRRLNALTLVQEMWSETNPAVNSKPAMESVAARESKNTGLGRTSSRPLFPFVRRSKTAEFSILQQSSR